ncbi:phosphoribosylglycinamide formyltransferase [Ornithinimicrobium sp. Arc0846-15]|nr:phosphoribosylglycinamide formyltransferase [Ornithinimicrobium laminariae]
MPVVVLVSGSGTNLQALIDASQGNATPWQIVAVGADRPGIAGLERAESAGIPTFVCPVKDYPQRSEWDTALADHLMNALPEAHDGRRWVVSAGFMKVLGTTVLNEFTVLNTHPALLPAFPGAHGVRDAMAYGAKVTGATLHFVDEGVDTGPIVSQRIVAINDDDTEDSLHERIKVAERDMLVRGLTSLLSTGFTLSDRKVTLL